MYMSYLEMSYVIELRDELFGLLSFSSTTIAKKH